MSSQTGWICCCNSFFTFRPREFVIKNRVRALWGSPLSYEMVASVADPYYLHIQMRVVFRRGFLGRVFFVFFALSHFCDLASLWCLLHPRPLELCVLQWFVQVHFRRASVTVRHYGAFCTGGLSSPVFYNGSCRSIFGGLQ